MDAFLNRFWWLKSRKMWTMIGAVVTLLTTASSQDPYPTNAVIQGLVAIALGYMGTVAWEDVATKNAAAVPTTTIETPSQNVEISTSDTGTPHPTPPALHGGIQRG